MVGNGEFLTELRFVGDKSATKHVAECRLRETLPVFDAVTKWLDIYFSGEVPNFTPPLLLSGSTFRCDVWQILRRIPYGTTTTYGEIAAQIHRNNIVTMSPQAVGGAIKNNPVQIIVPCHRVIAKSGKLTGYAGGLWRKKFLLRLENKQ